MFVFTDSITFNYFEAISKHIILILSSCLKWLVVHILCLPPRDTRFFVDLELVLSRSTLELFLCTRSLAGYSRTHWWIFYSNRLFSFISVFESHFSFFVSRSFHETSYLRLIGQEEIASDWWRVTWSCVAFCSHVRLSTEPFNPYAYLLLVGHLYLWSFLLVSCIYSPNSPTHIFRPASVEFINKSSYASIYSFWCLNFAQDLMVKMGQNRPST